MTQNIVECGSSGQTGVLDPTTGRSFFCTIIARTRTLQLAPCRPIISLMLWAYLYWATGNGIVAEITVRQHYCKLYNGSV